MSDSDDIVKPWKFGEYNRTQRRYMHPNYEQRSYRMWGGGRCWRQVASTYTFYSNGLTVIILKAHHKKLNKGLWENFHHGPLPHNVTVNMKRGTFKSLLPWLRYDFPKWTVEIVPMSGYDDKTFDTPVEFKIGFESEKDCAIFLLYMDAILAGDVPVSIPEPVKRVRTKRPK